MKLYATVTSERNSRPAKKGGDKYLEIKINDNLIITTTALENGQIVTGYSRKLFRKWSKPIEIDREFTNKK